VAQNRLEPGRKRSVSMGSRNALRGGNVPAESGKKAVLN